MQFDQSSTDNPDQRISDDLDRFTSISLALSIGLLNSVVTLFSFLFILWTLSGALHIPLGGDSGFDIPGYMVIAAFFYAAVGTWLTRKIGSPLVRLLAVCDVYAALCSPRPHRAAIVQSSCMDCERSLGLCLPPSGRLL